MADDVALSSACGRRPRRLKKLLSFGRPEKIPHLAKDPLTWKSCFPFLTRLKKRSSKLSDASLEDPSTTNNNIPSRATAPLRSESSNHHHHHHQSTHIYSSDDASTYFLSSHHLRSRRTRACSDTTCITWTPRRNDRLSSKDDDDPLFGDPIADKLASPYFTGSSRDIWSQKNEATDSLLAKEPPTRWSLWSDLAQETGLLDSEPTGSGSIPLKERRRRRSPLLIPESQRLTLALKSPPSEASLADPYQYTSSTSKTWNSTPSTPLTNDSMWRHHLIEQSLKYSLWPSLDVSRQQAMDALEGRKAGKSVTMMPIANVQELDSLLDDASEKIVRDKAHYDAIVARTTQNHHRRPLCHKSESRPKPRSASKIESRKHAGISQLGSHPEDQLQSINEVDRSSTTTAISIVPPTPPASAQSLHSQSTTAHVGFFPPSPNSTHATAVQPFTAH
ncbi:uncharacterized protein BYT42DRAFT_611414 [Radiomyces spectabilis]|uniref:uncharacterized protein n=1 Tax=Radiomyces spectabilis TaxID=64574 RepID=UPI00221EB7A1|nr:uncharacterized protein BYT42DRAFT_611414 [Radiomyces spectabilis]KAI8388356.1 hypothetical protein BYT42DRAFT_611414 [Radiomyces spectabilis]